MGIRGGASADAHIGWLFVVIATVVSPGEAAATGSSSGTRILYVEPLPGLLVQTGAALRKPASRATQLQFDAYGRRFDLTLTENSGLSVHVQAKTGTSPLRLYRGRIDGVPNSWVRLAGRNSEVHGMMWDGADLYVLEPASAALESLTAPLDARAADTVIFRLADVLMDSAASCASEDAPKQLRSGAETYDALMRELKGSPAMMQAAGAVRRLDISALGDSMFLRRHADEQEARDAILIRLNIVDGIFSSQLGIELRVASLSVSDAQGDPLSGTAAPKSLLDELGLLRTRRPELSSGGLTHLFTGRDLEGTTVGIAYLDSLCHSRYGAGLTEAESAWRDSLVAAHEIGHNFGADHDGNPQGTCPAVLGDQYLMSAAVSGSNNFSQCSLSRMEVSASSASCITSLPPADVGIPSDLGTQREAVRQRFDWELAVTNVGGLAAQDVRVEILLPPVLVIEDAYVSGGTCTSGAGVVQCQLGNVAGGATHAVHLALSSETIGSSLISASISSLDDAWPANDRGEGTLVIEPEADLGISMQGPSATEAGVEFSLAFEVANRAAVEARGIDILMDLPAGVSAKNPAIANGSCAVESARVRCALESLAPGGTASGSVSVSASFPGDVTLRAQVSGNYVDPDASNDRVDFALSVAGDAPLAQQASRPSGGGGSTGPMILLALAGLWSARRRS